MSFNVIAAVMQSLPPEMVTKVATALGIERAAALKAVSAAVPAILGKLAARAATAEGAGTLAALISAQNPDVLASFATTLGGPQEGALIDAGTRLMRTGIGVAETDGLAAALAQYANISPKLSQNLLGVIAPLAAGTLARHPTVRELGAAGLVKLLAQQKETIMQAMPGAFAQLFAATPSTAAVAGTLDAPTPATQATVSSTVEVQPLRPRTLSPALAGAAASALAHGTASGTSVLGRAPDSSLRPGPSTDAAASIASAAKAAVQSGDRMAGSVVAPVAAAVAVAAENVTVAPIAAKSAEPAQATSAAPTAALAKPAALVTPSAPATPVAQAATVAAVASKATSRPTSPVSVSAAQATADAKPLVRPSADTRPASPPTAAPAVPAPPAQAAVSLPAVATVQPSRPAVGSVKPSVVAATGIPRQTAAATGTTSPMPPPYVPTVARRSVPLIAWLVPVMLLAAGGAWWLKDRGDKAQVAAIVEQARSAAEAKMAADKIASLKTEADAAAKAAADRAVQERAAAEAAAGAKLAAEAEARQAEMKRQAEVSAAAKIAQEAADRRRQAEADAQSKVATGAIVAPSVPAEPSAADVAAKAEADAKQAAETAARQEAERQAEAQRAEARRQAEAEAAAKLAAETESRRIADAAAAVEAKNRADLQNCQKSVREVSSASRVQFEYASDILRSEGVAVLSRIVESMKSCPAVRVRVEGHTDSEGDLGRNQRLSENRAKSVAEFLRDAGIATNRMVSVGYGQTRPVVPNDSERNRARNRRIDFVIVE